jgi:hypothetical protein
MRHVVGRHAADLAPLEGDAALRRAHEAHHGLERRALADAVPAEQPHDLPGPDFDGHAVEDVGLAVVRMDVVEGQHQVLR